MEKIMLALGTRVLPSRAIGGLSITLALLFLIGGSSRADVQSIALLNPAMIFCCGLAALTLKPGKNWDRMKFLCGAMVALMLFVGLYYVPLPKVFGDVSSGGMELAAIQSTANAFPHITRLTVAPLSEWQTFFFLFGPLAVILFASQLKRDEVRFTVPLVIWLGIASGTLGLLQTIGPSDGTLYMYNITNNGSAVGLFANRNHAAVFLACLFPVLAQLAARPDGNGKGGRNTRRLLAGAIAIIIIPLILVTGSRAGVLASLIGIVGGLVIYASAGSNSYDLKARFRSPAIPIAVLILVVSSAVYFSRAKAIDRFFNEADVTSARAGFWTASYDLFAKYSPTGFGPGSFVPVYRSEEPLKLLNAGYLNQLHNDWLETVLTFGIPGMILMFSSLIYFLHRSFNLWMRMDGARSSVSLGRVASVVIAILAVASLSDYPLRTPAMSGFVALMIFWLVQARFNPEAD